MERREKTFKNRVGNRAKKKGTVRSRSDLNRILAVQHTSVVQPTYSGQKLSAEQLETDLAEDPCTTYARSAIRNQPTLEA